MKETQQHLTNFIMILCITISSAFLSLSDKEHSILSDRNRQDSVFLIFMALIKLS